MGGQDEVIYDGGSFVLGADRQLKVKLASFREEVATVEFRRGPKGWECQPAAIAPELDTLDSIYQAMMLGLRDLCEQDGFPLRRDRPVGRRGLRAHRRGGGRRAGARARAYADDALALYFRRVAGGMPRPAPRRSASEYEIVSIQPAMDAFRKMLLPIFGNRAEDVTEENIQSRARGVTLMAVSNKLGGMVVTTGNKSEMAVGYATLYGDMCGGFNVLKDVLQDDRVRALRLAQPARSRGRARQGGPRDPRTHPHQAAPRRSSGPSRRTPIRCRLIPCSTRS